MAHHEGDGFVKTIYFQRRRRERRDFIPIKQKILCVSAVSFDFYETIRSKNKIIALKKPEEISTDTVASQIL